jgi:MFS family permease
MRDVALPSPFSVKNVRLFIAFRLFFTARFYYPVFSILFLDFGLTVSQFALLNAIWAAGIVAAEVPSGALADTLGRKHLLVATGIMMVAELLLLCVAPIRGGGLLFGIFLVNRLLSALAEASASGADEALAYDALKERGLEQEWPRVLELQMRVQSLGVVVAMIVGGLVYDPDAMGRLASALGYNVEVTQDFTLRLPLLLTLGFGFFTLASALAMTESRQAVPGRGQSIAAALHKTFAAGRWILSTSFALKVILAGLIFDGVMRMVVTLASQYYRVIGIPEASFGFLGALVAALGLVLPKLARHLVKTRSAQFNLMILTGITLVSLLWMCFFSTWLGAIPALILFGSMNLVAFFVSHYLNQLAKSETRATVLSFKGLAYNLSYGLLGMSYATLLALKRAPLLRHQPGLAGQELEDCLFKQTFAAFPLAFIILLIIFLLFVTWQRTRKVEQPCPD